MRIVISGGGTGGHVFPAIELAIAFKQQQADVIMVGNHNSLEEKMAHDHNIDFFALSTKKIVGLSFINKIKALVSIAIAFANALCLLAKIKPNAVIGVGGYVSFPVVFASFFLGIKRYICEQNLMPGLANKVLSKIAMRIFISFEESRSYFPRDKTILTGNPVRKQFFNVEPKQFTSNMRILITGGSLGARFLNHHVPQALARIDEKQRIVHVTHQCGATMIDDVKKLYSDAKISASVVSFIDDMPRAFSEHDLLISRAGATVCAEIMAAGMAAILIPYPHANAHQKYNALALEKAAAAIMIEEGAHFERDLVNALNTLMADEKILSNIAGKAKSLGLPDASISIVRKIIDLG